MKDILQQIQNLKEDFMNLIEVEGLGQPASDVPPSTNKIKKDTKTKDGKVELVSVEDELFPYDGNKREQYRQKILDTINGMIQGTATLDDLLQVVRQKKMPVKESLDDQIEKKFKKGDISLDKAFDLIKKIESKMSSEKNNQERNDKIEKDAMKMSPSIERASYLRQVGKAIRRNQRKNALTFESLEEGIVILEEIINEYNMDKVKAALDKRIEQSMKADDEERKEFNDILNMKDRDKRAEAYKEFSKKSDKRFNDENKKLDLYAKYAKKYPELVEALTLMEAIINEVSVGTLARAVANNSKKIKDDAKKSEEQAHKAWDSYNKLSAEHPEDEPALYKAATELGGIAYKDSKKKEHVEDLEKLNLPKDSKVSANKFFKAANKSYDDRAREYDKLLDSGESRGKSYKETKESRPAKRYTRAARIAFADPVKARKENAD